MASVLSSFLVGIGWDTQDFDKGTKNIERSLGGVKSTALQVGAALFGAFGAKAVTMDFAKRTDELSQFSSAMGVAANDVQALGNALAYAGGDAGTATSLLAKLTEARDALVVKGNTAFLEDAAYSGIDPSLIKDAANSYDALMNIVGEFDSLSAAQQRTLAQTLGLSPSDIALFKTGRESVESSVAQFRKIRPATEEAAENSRKFRSELSLLGTQIGAVADQISVPLVGALGDATEAANKFIDANRPFIDKTVGKGVEFATDNFIELAGALGGLVTGGALATLSKMAKLVPVIGGSMGSVLAGASRLSYVGAAVSTGALLWDVTADDIENVTGFKPPEWLFKPINELQLNPWADVSDPYIEASRAASRERSDWWSSDTQPTWRETSTARPDVSTPAASADPMGYGSAAQASLRDQRMSQPSTALPPVQVTLQLDGRVLDERIIDVNERTASSVVEDLQTTTSR